MISELTRIENVYRIKNIGKLSEKIKTIKKISDHPILIFKKDIPFKRKSEIITLNTYNYNIIKNNMEQIKIITQTKIKIHTRIIRPKNN